MTDIFTENNNMNKLGLLAFYFDLRFSAVVICTNVVLSLKLIRVSKNRHVINPDVVPTFSPNCMRV